MHAICTAILSSSLLLLTLGNTHAAHPSFYTLAPGTPLCSDGDPVVCAWSIGGLIPTPTKYAVQALATYDPGCDGSAESSARFEFGTGANPSIAIAASALNKTVCASNDDPCSTPVTLHAARVQVRVKALHPPSKHGGAQDNPFSALSAPAAIAGVCAVACPQTCVNGIDQLLTEGLAQPNGAIVGLSCSYDSSQQAGSISFGVGNAMAGGSGLIGVGSCVASFNSSTLVSQGLSAAEQAACANHFAPILIGLSPTGTVCNVEP